MVRCNYILLRLMFHSGFPFMIDKFLLKSYFNKIEINFRKQTHFSVSYGLAIKTTQNTRMHNIQKKLITTEDMLKFYLNFIYKHKITCNQHNYKINNISLFFSYSLYVVPSEFKNFLWIQFEMGNITNWTFLKTNLKLSTLDLAISETDGAYIRVFREYDCVLCITISV